jgi:putative restriction endonuclease
MSLRLRAEEGDRDNTNDDVGYSPQEGDRRQVAERQIRERRGQQQFRDALCKRYGNRCLVTGSEVLAVLEAAHIKPYRGEDDNHPENGLLLRADIHTLFDLDLVGIEPEQLRVELHPDLASDKEYGSLAGKTLCCARDQRPSQEALRLRYEQFQQRVYRLA